MWLKFPRPEGLSLSVLMFSLMVSCSYLHGQNLIGYNYTDISSFMKKNRKDMHSNAVHNNSFSYLKYTDNSDSQTILFFLAPDSVCKSQRIVFDKGLKAQKLKELDENYVKVDKDMWIEKRGDKNFLMKFIEEDWSCTITIEPEN